MLPGVASPKPEDGIVVEQNLVPPKPEIPKDNREKKAPAPKKEEKPPAPPKKQEEEPPKKEDKK